MNRPLPPNASKPRWPTWLVFLLTSLLVSSQNTLALVGLPVLAERNPISPTQLGFLLGVFPFAHALASILIGPLSDLICRRRLMLAGQLILASSLSLHVFAIDPSTLLGLRCLAGLGSGILVSLPVPYLTSQYDSASQGKVLNRAASGHSLGQSLGIPLGILCLGSIDFLQLNSLCGLLAWFLFLLQLKYLPPSRPNDGPDRTRLSRQEYATVARSTFRNTNFNLIVLVSFLGFAATAMFYATTTLWLIHHFVWSPFEIAPLYLVGGLTQFAVMILFAPKGCVERPIFNVATSLLMNGLILLLWSFFMENAWTAMATFGLALGSIAFRIAPTQFLVASVGHPRAKGFRMGLNQSAQSLGRALGIFSGSALFFVIEPRLLILASATLLIGSASLLFIKNSFWMNHSDSPRIAPRLLETKNGIGTRSAELKMSRKQPTRGATNAECKL